MKIDLQTLEESIRNQMLDLARGALKYDGRFSYDGRQYVASEADNGEIEISLFQLLRYKVNNLSPQKAQELRDKIAIAKQSTNPDDKKFPIDDILHPLKESQQGSQKPDPHSF